MISTRGRSGYAPLDWRWEWGDLIRWATKNNRRKRVYVRAWSRRPGKGCFGVAIFSVFVSYLKISEETGSREIKGEGIIKCYNVYRSGCRGESHDSHCTAGSEREREGILRGPPYGGGINQIKI